MHLILFLLGDGELDLSNDCLCIMFCFQVHFITPTIATTMLVEIDGAQEFTIQRFFIYVPIFSMMTLTLILGNGLQ